MSGLRRLGTEVAWPLLVACLVFAGLVIGGVMAAGPALLTLGVMVLALLAGPWLTRLLAPADASDADVADNSDRPTWQAVLSVLADAAVLVDQEGKVLEANTSARSLFASLTIGGHVSNVSRHPEFLGLLSATEGDPRSATFVERVPLERRMAAMAVRLPTELASDAGWLVTLRDLTESHKLDQMRADFVANASHELRTPLASLLGFIETLRGPARDDAKARDRFLAIMATEGGRMKRLIDDLLSLSRIEMRQHLRPTERIDLAEVLWHVVEAATPQAEDAKVTVGLDLPPGTLTVFGDYDELVQLFGNLVQNAVKYGGSGGEAKIQVQWRGEKKAIEVAVSDKGPGIAPQHLPRLTERFYRTDTAVSRNTGGTGLGLAIVKHIVQRHRGELMIRSELGRGSTFTVLLEALS